MDVELREEQRALRDMIRDFARQEIAPRAAELDRHPAFPRENFDAMASLGLLGLMVPEAYGGAGGSTLDQCIVSEELSYACSATALSYLAHAVLVCHNLACNGSEAQKRRYLPDLCSGATLGSLCITEPGAGSDALGMQTTAELQGDRWCIHGSKTFITNATVADIFLVYVRTDPTDRNRGLSQFIVERNTPGLSVGQPFHKMGNRASPTAEVFFDDCLVPDENLVKGPNHALGILMGNLDVERTVGAAMSVGGAQAAFDKALHYAHERVQFGQSILGFEMIQDKIATMATHIEAARLLVWKAAAHCDGGRRCSKEASMAKLFASEMANRVTSEAVQILGGYGYMEEYEVERIMRDARLGSIGAGTSEIQKLIIARKIAQETFGTPS
tara:strand:+ start:189 stop:1349 length:1161 start_codon:yes stop_codon:yes gene_type:complete